MTGSGKDREGFTPDRTIHEPARLQIISYLAADEKQVSFTELKEKLGLTAGNLSVQLRKLEEAGYVTISKSFRERKPLTRVSLTGEGMAALQRYLAGLERMLEKMKKTRELPPGAGKEKN